MELFLSGVTQMANVYSNTMTFRHDGEIGPASIIHTGPEMVRFEIDKQTG